MKNQKLLVCCLLAIGSTLCGNLKAQKRAFAYERFRVDIKGAYALLASKEAISFYGAAAEIKYEVIPQLQIGLQSQAAIGLSIDLGKTGSGFAASGGFFIHLTQMLGADYYFTNTKWRPFAGLGVGYTQIIYIGARGTFTPRNFMQNRESPVSGNVSFGRPSGFAVRVRGGVEIAHVRVELAPEVLVFGQASIFVVNIAFGGIIGGCRLR